MKNKRYTVIIEETEGYIGGSPRIAGTRIPIEKLGNGLDYFKEMYPDEDGTWWKPSIQEEETNEKQKES